MIFTRAKAVHVKTLQNFEISTCLSDGGEITPTDRRQRAAPTSPNFQMSIILMVDQRVPRAYLNLMTYPKSGKGRWKNYHTYK